MRISEFIIIILVIGSVSVGIGNYHSDLANTYGVVNVTDSSYLNKTSNIVNKLDDMKETLRDTTLTGSDVLNLPFTVVSGAIGAIMMSYDIFDMGTTMIDYMLQELSLPIWVSGLVGGIITIIVISGVLYAFLKVKW